MLTVPVKSRKAQLEEMYNSKQSDFEKDFEGKRNESATEYYAACPSSDFSAKWLRSMPEQCFRTTSGCPARSSSYFDWFVRKSSAGAECCRTRRSLLERRFRALSGSEARPRSDFKRPVDAKRSRTMILSAKHALCSVSKCSPTISNIPIAD